MPRYEVRYGRPDRNGVFPFLGNIDYPYELKKGDVVILGEAFMNELRRYFPDVGSNQMWVLTVHYFLQSEGEQVPDATLYVGPDVG